VFPAIPKVLLISNFEFIQGFAINQIIIPVIMMIAQKLSFHLNRVLIVLVPEPGNNDDCSVTELSSEPVVDCSGTGAQ
jgi:hypothetical protein